MGTLTINTTAGEDTRLQAAYGKKLGVGTANAAQIKAAIIQQIKDVVQEQETATAIAAAVSGVTVISPT
jgi:hypothetical protein